MKRKKILSTEGFFRKSTFCTLVDANPGFDGHWVMPEIFLLNGTFTMLEMEAFLLKTFFNSMHWCKSATLKIANLAILNHYRGSSLSTIFGILKKSYYAKFVLVSTT